jgi:Flp pilus assembly protein TadG
MIGCRRGGIALIAALLFVPLIGFTAVAVDGMRAWLVYSRLLAALDAAALAGARNISVTAATRDNEVSSMFWTNIGVRESGWTAATGRTRGWRSFLDATVQLTILAPTDDRTYQVQATATLPTTFGRVFSINDVTMRAAATARRQDLGLELALVLDVTGSMDTNCSTPSNRTTTDCGVTTIPRSQNQTITARNNNMDLLRLASADLVNILYGNSERVPNLYVSVVPYSATVNLGPSRTGWLAAASQSTLTADYSPTSWRGCVEARIGYTGAPSDGDRVDYAPSEVPFRPYLHRTTLGVYTRSGARVPGDNDWARKLWNATTTGTDAITEDWQLWRGNYQVGPNVGCPMTAVLPLNAAKTTVLDTIQALRPSFRGGTMGNLGLLAGWFTLSPRWRTAWALGPAPDAQATSLPLAYNTQNMRKAIVLMTDGDNNWYDPPYGYPGDCSESSSTSSFPTSGAGFAAPGPNMAVRPVSCPSSSSGVAVASGGPAIANNADYTGYGRLAERRLGSGITSGSQATTEINNRFAQLCTTIKQTGIIIYTVILGNLSSATQSLYQNCATSTANYYAVTTPSQLRPAFQQIANQLSNLRLVQ